MSDIWDAARQASRAIWLWTCVLQEKRMILKVVQRLARLPLPPWDQMYHNLCPEGTGLPQWQAWKTGAPSQWAWRMERGAEDYSSVLKSNEISLVKFCSCLGPLTPFFSLLMSPFWNGDVYCVPVSLLYFEADSFSRLTGSQLERKLCLRMNHTSSPPYLI